MNTDMESYTLADQLHGMLAADKAYVIDIRKKVDYDAGHIEGAVNMPAADVADHIDHVVNLIGIDHVGIGSDFDGVGDSLPVGLKDVSGYPNLIYELLKRGYSEKDIEKICSGNLLWVWKGVDENSLRLRLVED